MIGTAGRSTAVGPAGSEDAGAEEWNGVYRAQLNKLLADQHVNPAGVLFTGAFCQSAALPVDPLIAAFLVCDLVMENDYLLRTGCPQGEIMARMKAVWNRHLRENRGLLGAGVRERKAKKDRTPAGPLRFQWKLNVRWACAGRDTPKYRGQPPQLKTQSGHLLRVNEDTARVGPTPRWGPEPGIYPQGRAGPAGNTPGAFFRVEIPGGMRK